MRIEFHAFRWLKAPPVKHLQISTIGKVIRIHNLAPSAEFELTQSKERNARYDLMEVATLESLGFLVLPDDWEVFSRKRMDKPGESI